MDATQLEQMVSWLDEEHRRDRGEVGKLQQRIESQNVEIAEQARRIQELEGRLANTQAQLARYAQVDETLQQFKNEIVLMMQKHLDQTDSETRERERIRVSERESVARTISEIRKELNRFGRIDEELALRRSEDQRLSELTIGLRQSVTALNKDIDERMRNIPYIVDQRAQDNKRIVQLQQENVELFKRIEEQSGKTPLLQDRLQKLERSVTNVQPIVQDLKREQLQFIEEMRASDVDRQREMQKWHDELISQREVFDRQRESLLAFAEQLEVSRRAVASIGTFQETIEREINQVAELQRLAEERQRKEMETWIAENEKRWKRQVLQLEHQTEEQAKVNRQVSGRFPSIDERLRQHDQQIQRLWRLQETEGMHRLAEAQRWLTQLEEFVKEKTQTSVG